MHYKRWTQVLQGTADSAISNGWDLLAGPYASAAGTSIENFNAPELLSINPCC